MLETLLVIAALCNYGCKTVIPDLRGVDAKQVGCQQWYLNCIGHDTIDRGHEKEIERLLVNCVIKRKVKIKKPKINPYGQCVDWSRVKGRK
jgi:hypothetical protein